MTTTLTAAPTRHRVALPGVAGSVAAAAATTAVAVTARAAGIGLTDGNGEPIPLLAFPQLTVICGLLGALLAVVLARRAARPRRTFVRVTVTLTALSLVPPFLIGADGPSAAVLVAAHLLAAAVVIPTLAARLR